eukprot:scaffold273_cov242-Pinguiococcus_pyrenoidosus.AAC.10
MNSADAEGALPLNTSGISAGRPPARLRCTAPSLAKPLAKLLSCSSSSSSSRRFSPGAAIPASDCIFQARERRRAERRRRVRRRAALGERRLPCRDS